MPGVWLPLADGVTDCPTNATVRPVLYRRRGEDTQAVDRLTADQFADLHDRKNARVNRAAARRAARPALAATDGGATLFDLTGGNAR